VDAFVGKLGKKKKSSLKESTTFGKKRAEKVISVFHQRFRLNFC
jgi:hypothetical protein